MFIKMFRTVQVRVPDPLRPGRRTFEDKIFATGCTGIGHEGQEYKADEDGWIEVTHEMGQHFLKLRYPNGERFYSPEEVDEQVRLGAVDGEKEDSLPSKSKKAIPA